MKSLVVPVIAILTLGGLETVALLNGINGALFSGVTATIGGIGGYSVYKRKAEKEVKK